MSIRNGGRATRSESMDTHPLTSIFGFRLVTVDLVHLTRFYRGVPGCTAEGSIRSTDGAEMALLGLRGRGRRQLLSIGEQQVALDGFEPPGRP